MKRVIQLVFIPLVLVACNHSENGNNASNNPKEIQLQTDSVKTQNNIEKTENYTKIRLRYFESDRINGELVTTVDSVYTLDSKYFSISLAKLVNGGFNAEKYIKKSSVSDPKSKMFFIIGENNYVKQFNDETEFLNYMDSAGYEFKSKESGKYNIDFIFERK